MIRTQRHSHMKYTLNRSLVRVRFSSEKPPRDWKQ